MQQPTQSVQFLSTSSIACNCYNIALYNVNCLWLVGVTLIFDVTLQIIVQRYQIVALRWSNDISSAADNAIFKNSAQSIEYSFGCMARSAVLWKPNFANILLFNFCEQKFIQHGPLTVAVDRNDHFLFVFEEKWPNYASRPKFASNSDSFWVRQIFNVCPKVRQVC